jgi:hypothetical protein
MLNCSLSRIHQQMLNLANTNVSKQNSALEVGDLLVKDNSSEHQARNSDDLLDLASSQTSAVVTASKARRTSFSQYQGRYLYFKVDSYHAIESLLTSLGVALPSQWNDRLQRYLFSLTYSSAAHYLYMDDIPTILRNIKRRFRIQLFTFAFQLQTTSLPRALTYIPIAPCQSQIFKLCLDGNIDMVKIWFKGSRVSPFVVNQHGENLLHVSNISCIIPHPVAKFKSSRRDMHMQNYVICCWTLG